jgi:hypothetical protein
MWSGMICIAVVGFGAIAAEEARCRRKLAKLDRLQWCVNHCGGDLITLERMLRNDDISEHNRTRAARKSVPTR